MRSSVLFIVFLVGLSLLSGWLMSRMSWLGRVGIALFHPDYHFLKSWYKGAAFVFIMLMLLYGIQSLIQKRCTPRQASWLQAMAILAACLGLWLTYRNFQTDFSHRILKERFHLGAYLFWLAWISISLRLLWLRQPRKKKEEDQVRSHEKGSR